MQPKEFLSVVLPTEGDGFYCAAQMPSKKHVFAQGLDAISNAAELFALGNTDSYYALASFRESGSRKAHNALAVRAIFIDIDCGDDKAYAKKKDAVEALSAFMDTTGLSALGKPWLVDSGGGVHGYLPLFDDVCIEDWKPVAEAFKRTAKRLDLRIDMTVTADAARVLRVPGTTNFKYSPPRPVVLRQIGDIFNLEDIAARLDASSQPSRAVGMPMQRPAGLPAPLSATMQALAQNSTTLFKNIMVRTIAGTGCGQIKHYFEHATEDGMEPLWRGIMSIAQKCDDGAKALIKITDAHPYPHARMHQKLAEIKGPYPCTKLDSENPGICGDCPHWGKITNPLALGRAVKTEVGPKEYVSTTPEDDDAPIRPTAPPRPNAPYGFSYGASSGVYRQVAEVDSKGGTTTREVLITPYDFYLVDLLQEGATYLSRFAAVRQKTVTYVALPSEALASKDATIKCLSSQNVMASFGAGCDAHLAAYVRACVQTVSENDAALIVPPRYGWQPDASFALCDTVIQQAGHSYTFPSNNLRNLINSTKTHGTLGDWQRYVQLIQDKGLWDILGFLGASFGSPLMEFAGAGTPAMMFHACGKESGRGKTLALQLAASVWGSTTDYLVKPSTSERTMMQRAGMLGNLPLIVDEVTDAQRKSKGEFIPTLVFDYSQGGHKIKGSGSANSELINDLFWRANGIISSNEPAMEKMLTMRETTSFGELYRMLEWNATQELLWTEPEQALKHLLEDNYGHAGRVYAKWLVDNRATAQRVTAECIAKVRKLLNANDSERFYVAGIGTSLAGLTLAGPGYANIFPFDVKNIFKHAYAQWVFNARALISANVTCAKDLLAAYVKEFHGKFVMVDTRSPMAVFQDGRNVSSQSTRGRVAGRIECDVRKGWKDFFIEVATFKQFCGSRNQSYKAVVAELSQTFGVIKESRRDLLAKTGGPELRVNCLQISTLIDDEDDVEDLY